MIDRRTLIAAGGALAAVPAFARAPKSAAFPADFIWGAATAGHQVEGNNTNSDVWFLENVKPTVFAEQSGDADNSLELWPVDLDLAKSLNLNAYRSVWNGRGSSRNRACSRSRCSIITRTSSRDAASAACGRW